MKLRNKKTGEIGNLKLYNNDERVCVWIDDVSEPDYIYNSLAELNAEWEDAPEEPKDIWWLDNEGRVNHASGDLNDSFRKNRKIGNYFLSREEAEKAVEKLKARQRLKDRGFRFTAWYGGSKNISYEITSLENETYIPRQICDDLDLLFGGEE